MRSLLVLLVLTSLAASSQAWPSWSDIKQKVSGVTDDIKDGWDQHIDPLFDDAKDSWDDHVQPFLDEVAEKAKNFVLGHRDNFNDYAAALKEKAAKLDECRDCADSGTCGADKNEECEELYGVFSKVFKFYDCFNAEDTPKCINGMTAGRGSGKSEEKDDDESEEKPDEKSEEKDEDKSVNNDLEELKPVEPKPPTEAEKVIQETVNERRARKLLRELLKSNA